MPFDHPPPQPTTTTTTTKPKKTTTTTSPINLSNHPLTSNPIHDESSYTRQLHQIYAGAVAGCATRAATQPFDVLKIRFQLQVEPVSKRYKTNFMETPTPTAPPTPTATTPTPTESSTNQQPQSNTTASKYTSFNQAARRILKEEGIRAFWKGHNSGQFTSITYGIAQFWTYEQLKVRLHDAAWLHYHRHLTDFVSGGAAGMAAAIVSTPFDVIRTRIVAADHGVGYRNIFHAFSTIVRHEGTPGLFRGLTPTIIQIVPLVGFNFLFYGFLNDIAETVLTSKNGHLPTWWLLTSGGIAGISSKILIYPLDFIKKRLQMRGFEKHRTTYGRTQACRSLLDCINLTIRDEGYLGFYKGLTPTLLKSGLTTALYFSVYDKVKELLEKNERRKKV